MTRWLELADGVFVRRYPDFDLNIGLVVGPDGCVVIDTRADPAQGAELLVAVRQITAAPITVVITHDHFDHCLGTSALSAAQVWAHPRCRANLAAGGARQHEEAGVWCRELGLPQPVPVEPVVPDHVVVDQVTLPGCPVTLLHPGPGHTDHDLVVWVPDAGVLFAGDLVEQGAPPDFTDAVPHAWPAVLDALLALSPEVVVPGHGAVVDVDFVARQRAAIALLVELCGEGLDSAEVVQRSPYDERTTRVALGRLVR